MYIHFNKNENLPSPEICTLPIVLFMTKYSNPPLRYSSGWQTSQIQRSSRILCFRLKIRSTTSVEYLWEQLYSKLCHGERGMEWGIENAALGQNKNGERLWQRLYKAWRFTQGGKKKSLVPGYTLLMAFSGCVPMSVLIWQDLSEFCEAPATALCSVLRIELA